VDFDLAVLAAANLVTPDAPRSQVADEFRVVKRPLINNVKSANGSSPARNNLIMVTSAVAGEGKSFTAINLAMSIAAELDNTVMLVDADLARPSLPTMLGGGRRSRLLDLLDGSAEMSDVLLRTNIEKLTFLRGGTPHARATELLASEAMRGLVGEMSERYRDRIIVFDSPPLLLTTEARALAMYMGRSSSSCARARPCNPRCSTLWQRSKRAPRRCCCSIRCDRKSTASTANTGWAMDTGTGTGMVVGPPSAVPERAPPCATPR
jgi:exopolysaccharide/PEP-CTERM locus tyrosine autokinase